MYFFGLCIKNICQLSYKSFVTATPLKLVVSNQPQEVSFHYIVHTSLDVVVSSFLKIVVLLHTI